MDPLRMLISGSLCAAAALAIAWLPLPRYVTCGVLVEPHDAATLYVDVPGRVREVLVAPFAPVAPGQPLVRLENIDLELNLTRLEGEREQLAARLEALRERALVDDDAAHRVAQTAEALAALDAQCARQRAEARRLTITAPAAGVLLPALQRGGGDPNSGRLASWSGHPLETRNVGAWLDTGAVIGQIDTGHPPQLLLAIDETDIDFVQPGQRIDLVLDELPGERLSTVLTALSADELKHAPLPLARKTGGRLDTRTDAAGQERPARTTYQASARLTTPDPRILTGSRGTARIATGSEPLGRRLWRELCRTLAWDL